AARAVTFGFAVGTDLDNPTLNPTLITQIENAKALNALTINGDVSGAAGYQTNVALNLQPTAPPVQGSTTGVVFNFTPQIDNFSTANKGAVFNALPVVTQLGIAVNTLQAGDKATDTAGDGTLNMVTAPLTIGANPAFATGVTLSGISTANITGNSGALTGFQGTITGLLVENSLNSNDPIQLGGLNQGLKTLLTNINITGYAGPAEDANQVVIPAGAADLTKTINIGITGTLGRTTAGGAAEINISNDLGGGTQGNPNNTYGTWAITADSTANLQLGPDFDTGAGETGVGGATTLTLAGAATSLAGGQDGAGQGGPPQATRPPP